MPRTKVLRLILSASGVEVCPAFGVFPRPRVSSMSMKVVYFGRIWLCGPWPAWGGMAVGVGGKMSLYAGVCGWVLFIACAEKEEKEGGKKGKNACAVESWLGYRMVSGRLPEGNGGGKGTRQDRRPSQNMRFALQFL